MIEERLILIIDDHAEDRAVVRQLLDQVQACHYLFAEESLGLEALNLCETLHPACILLASSLPDMSGIDLLRELRLHRRSLNFIPVIMLADHENEAQAVQAIKAGAQEYLKKQACTAELLHMAIDNAIEYMYLQSALYDMEVQQATLFQLEKLARRQAEEANDTKTRFIGMISHELASPLASIKALSDSMMSEKATYDQARRILKIIGDEADRLYDMVSQLMDLARMQSASLTLRPEEKSLHDVVDSFQLQLSAMTPNHCLRVNIPDALPSVWIDAHRIKQVILNLVANAVKFSPLNTWITLKAFSMNGGIQVEVCDEGKGIPVDKRTCVFEAFQQLDTPSQYKGVGLGLAICKGIIEAHGGRIWIADDVVSGTIVCFTLPISLCPRVDR